MRRAALMAGVVLAMAAAHDGVGAQAAPAGHLTVSTDSRIWVEGGSNVRSYKCTAKALEASVTTGAEGPIAPLPGLVGTASVTVSTAALECGNGTMNEHMRKALKLTEHPNISFKLESYDVQANGTLTGKLQIAGQERPIQFPATFTDDGSTIRVQGNKAINMKEWGVKPPSLMLGTMKVKELVTIYFDVIVKR